MKSLLLFYPSNNQTIQLKTAFQVNKLAKILMDGSPVFSNVLEFDLEKCNKISLNLEGILAVLSLTKQLGHPYILEIAFKDGRSYNIPIWGEKRARNSYYFFREKMHVAPDQKFYKVLQTNEKDFSLVKFSDSLQIVKLHDPEVNLNEGTKTTYEQNTSNNL